VGNTMIRQFLRALRRRLDARGPVGVAQPPLTALRAPAFSERPDLLHASALEGRQSLSPHHAPADLALNEEPSAPPTGLHSASRPAAGAGGGSHDAARWHSVSPCSQVNETGRLIFRCPLPPAELSASGRGGDPQLLGGAAARYRAACRAVALAAGGDHGLPFKAASLALVFELVMPAPPADLDRYRPCDPDHAWAACAPLVEALRDAGLLTGDGLTDLALQPVRVVYVSDAPASRSAVRVRLAGQLPRGGAP